MTWQRPFRHFLQYLASSAHSRGYLSPAGRRCWSKSTSLLSPSRLNIGSYAIPHSHPSKTSCEWHVAFTTLLLYSSKPTSTVSMPCDPCTYLIQATTFVTARSWNILKDVRIYLFELGQQALWKKCGSLALYGGYSIVLLLGLIPQIIVGQTLNTRVGMPMRWHALKSSWSTITSLYIHLTPISQSKKPLRSLHLPRLHTRPYTTLSWPIHQTTHLQKPGDKTPRQPRKKVPRVTSSAATYTWFLYHHSRCRIGGLSEDSDLISGTSKGCALWR